MGLKKRTYTDQETVITAENLNAIQDAILDLEDGLLSVENDKSGVVITMTDAAKRGFKSFNIYGKTIQDGVPTPDAPVNLVSAGNGGSIGVMVASGKNLLKITETTKTTKGITFTVNGDGSITVNGTATDDAFFHAGIVNCLANTKYRLTGGPSGGTNDTCYLYYKYGGTTNHYAKDYGNGAEFTPDADVGNAVIITVVKGVTVSNKVFRPMLSLASEVDTGYEPYKGQTITTSTPNGLPGLPVASGGNYTDANGQQWVCDEIDFNAGKLIKRCGHYVFNGLEQWSDILISSVNGTPYVRIPVARSEKEYDTDILCNIGIGQRWVGPQYTLFINGYEYFAVGGDALRGAETVGEFKEIIAANPIELVYKLETPIETPLSEEELAAYSALHTYKDSTTVSNDAGAWMELEYVVDTKKYLGSFFQSSGGRLVNVALPASAWVGSGNIHSQVVQIDGVTNNTQVNLTPSISQMAIFYEKDITFITENDGGVVTVYVIGQKPTNDYTIQANLVEVGI